MQTYDERGGSRSTIFQSTVVKLILKIGLLLLISGLVIWKFPQYAIGIIILIVIIFILSGQWIKKYPLLEFFLIIIIIFIVLFFLATTLLSNIGVIGSRTASSMVSEGSNSWSIFKESVINFFKNPFYGWKDFLTKQKDIATGNYFVGQVEESKEDKELGLYLEKLESYTMDLKEGKESVFWVRLKGKTIGDNLIEGTLDCNASEGNDLKIDPTQPIPFSIYSYEMEDYQCRFSSLPGGKSIKINFWVDYNFKTLGYTKAYFIDQERLRTLRSLNKDPLDEVGIKDKNPISVYTNGPIRMGIGTYDYQPIPVNQNNDRLFVLGITLETKDFWKGKINKINELEIQIPKSMIINDPESKCDHKFEITNDNNCKKRCEGNEECILECDEYLFYKLSDQAKNEISEIENYRTFRCPVSVFTKNDLLGNSPVSTKYIRVIADYSFRTELGRTFFIKKEIQ